MTPEPLDNVLTEDQLHALYQHYSPTFRAIQRALDRPDGQLRYLIGGDHYQVNDVYEFTDPKGYNQVRVVGAPDAQSKPGGMVTVQAVYQTRPRRYVGA